MKDKFRRCHDRNYPRNNIISAEMRLIMHGGCHPDCQHMQYCVRCGLLCKAAYNKLKSSMR